MEDSRWNKAKSFKDLKEIDGFLIGGVKSSKNLLI